ncbi:hypothetical protein AB1Y20_008191 [Prymnesium parvum]|uniref:Uncharacterized protein n=1 Tax=Prymnesium parvum TaxID=97485 RepID=A0AB34IU73_PRYPA
MQTAASKTKRRVASPSKSRDHGTPTPKGSPSKSPSRKRAQSPPVSPIKLEPGESYAKPPHTEVTMPKEPEPQGLAGDYGAIALLMLLYTLQGIPMGLHASLPLIMAERKVLTSELAFFSFASYPFSFKLLWAPLVDSIYSSSFGRRKTWIVPAQAAIGLLLTMCADQVEVMLGAVPGDAESGTVNVKALTYLFFTFYVLAATQDIAVDGLALTVLSARNKELGATCNAIGQTVGFFLANVGFFALSSYGLTTLASFMKFWGWVFLASTVCVLFVKRDEHVAPTSGVLSEIVSAYKEMLLVMQLPSVRTLALVLLTCKAPLAAFDALVSFELMAEPINIPKERLAFLGTIMIPIGIITQAHVSKSFSESKPLGVWMYTYKLRLAIGAALIGFIIWLRQITSSGAAIPPYMYALGLGIMAISSATSAAMFVAQMAFFNRVSDPRIGGTYMTMLNTVANLGGQWPGTVVLAIKGELEKSPKIDAFSIICACSAVMGVVWVMLTQRTIHDIQNRPLLAWKASS